MYIIIITTTILQMGNLKQKRGAKYSLSEVGEGGRVQTHTINYHPDVLHKIWQKAYA